MKYQYKNCIFYDMGHGGLDPITKRYTTPPSNGKWFDHKTGKFHNDSSIFYEGVKNRDYGFTVVNNLRKLGVNVIVVNDQFIDTPLQIRTDLANYYHNNIQKGFYISEHSNAANGNARGFQVWTSIGQTTSDKYATMLMNMYKAEVSSDTTLGVRVMEDMRDGDPDYEQNFHVLSRTAMPAVLTENLFFDNRKDAETLLSDDYKKAYTDMQTKFLINVLEDLEK